MFSSHKHCDAQIAQLHSQISDLTAAILQLQQAFAEERRELLDRLLTMTNPGDIRELMVTRMPRVEPKKNEPRPETKLSHVPIDNPAGFKPTEPEPKTEAN